MEREDKARTFGFLGCSLALIYYAYEVYFYAKHWSSMKDIKETTQCRQIYVLELWLLTQNLLWVTSILMLMAVLVQPTLYKLLLCFLYIMGPVYFLWTGVAMGYDWAFEACCKEHMDGCVHFYPYTNASGFFALLVVSLLFSALISLYLIVIVAAVFWRYVERAWNQYSSLVL